jgi:hypothetical protein
MKNTLVTSFTLNNYDEYAKNMLSTFREFWPKSINLVIYYEGEAFPEIDTENVEWRRVEEIQGFTKWMQRIQPFPYVCGQTPHGYDIQHDARMVRKALTEIHGCNTFGGKVWWCDGDIITHQKVPENWLDSLLPDDKFNAFLGREWGDDPQQWVYTESGFIGFNSEHPLFEPFMRSYWEIFWSGLFFTLKGWHDCYGFDAVRHAVNMSEHFVDMSSHLETMHPLINSELGTYLDHAKGPRKTEGRSKNSDLIAPRTEAHWQ